VRRELRKYDVVGTLERFDATLLLLSDLSGLPNPVYRRAIEPVKNRDGRPIKATPKMKAATLAKACPDMDECKARVRELAPFDHLLYDEFSKAFDQRLAALGPDFERRLAVFSKALNAEAKSAERYGDGPHSVSAYYSGGKYYKTDSLCKEAEAVYRTLSKKEVASMACPKAMPVGTSVAPRLCRKVYTSRSSACAWHLPNGMPAKLKPRRSRAKAKPRANRTAAKTRAG